MKYCDLHLHSVFSDGSCQPEQLVRDTALMGMEVIAITDHDHTEGYYRATVEAERWGIEVLTGVEISTTDYHILGYNFDIEDNNLQELLEYSRQLQEKIARKKIDRVRETGVPISIEKVKRHSPGARLGEGNIMVAMKKDRECRDYINSISEDEIFERYFNKGGIAKDVGPNTYVSVDDAIESINSAGGIAGIAHPFKDVENYAALKGLFSSGIQFLEIQPNYKFKNRLYELFAEEKKCLVTFGSDYHGPSMQNRPLLKKDKNLVEEFWR